MRQSKAMSLLEAVVNTVVGLGVAMVATAAICKAYGIPMTWENNFIITFWMTVISIVRSYLLRRLFNGGWKSSQLLEDVILAHSKWRSGNRWRE